MCQPRTESYFLLDCPGPTEMHSKWCSLKYLSLLVALRTPSPSRRLSMLSRLLKKVRCHDYRPVGAAELHNFTRLGNPSVSVNTRLAAFGKHLSHCKEGRTMQEASQSKY